MDGVESQIVSEHQDKGKPRSSSGMDDATRRAHDPSQTKVEELAAALDREARAWNSGVGTHSGIRTARSAPLVW